MASLSLPSTIEEEYWLRSVKSAPELEKTTKLSGFIAKVRSDFVKVENALKKFDLSDTDLSADPKKATKEIQALVEKTHADIIDPLKGLLSGPVKKLEDEANKAGAAAKKAGKEAVVKAITTALKSFRSDANGLIETAVRDLESLAKGNKPTAKAADPGDKKASEALNKQIQRYNMMAKKAIRELRSGKLKSLPFVFAANKVKTPYKKGSKEWSAKSLIHIHLKAGQGSRNILIKLTECASPVFGIGEVRCEDKKKLIFDCTKTPPANIKQLKDALLFQCGYAPALKVMKGAKVEGDEAADGEDSGETIGDIPEDDDEDTLTVATEAPVKTPVGKTPTVGDAAPVKAGAKDDADADKAKSELLKKDAKARFTTRSAAIQNAIKAGGKKGNEVKALALDVARQIGNSGDGKQASTLMEQLDELLATSADVVDAAADVIGAASASPELQAALRDLAAQRARAVTGITRVAEIIRRSYQGDPQAAKAVEGAKKVDGAKQELKADVETQIAALLKVTDRARRAALASAARRTVADYRKRIVEHELLRDVDKSVFDPNLNVIEPYLNTLQRTETLLGDIKA